MIRTCVPLVAALVLSACVETPPAGPKPGTGGIIPQSTCGADLLQGLVGQPLAGLPPVQPGVTLRVIRPGDAITKDFSLQRLNAYLDNADTITQLTCG